MLYRVIVSLLMLATTSTITVEAQEREQRPTADSTAIDTLSVAEASPVMCDSLKRLCDEYAVLKATKLSYNAGVVNYKREVKHEFEIKNIGSKPLIILSIRTGSSSMKAKAARRPLNPGQSAKLRVEYEISKMPLGEFMRNIEVTSNSCGGSVTVFTLSGHSVDFSK